MSVNRVFLLGNATKDCELRYTASGTAVANFGLATNERYKDASGEWKDKAEFHNIVVWGKRAESCGKYVVKGKQLHIEGKIQTRSYESRDGDKKYITEIVAEQVTYIGRMSDDSGQRSQTPSPRQENAPRSEYGSGTGGGGAYQEPPFNPDDDIPFLTMPECRFDGDALYRSQLFKF